MQRNRARTGFTMIEMMAAVVLFALLAAMVGPRISALTSRDLRREAEELAHLMELGRQRAVVTGISHRVVLDLEEGSYTLEWAPAADPELEIEPAGAGDAPIEIDLAAPVKDRVAFEPLPGMLGDTVLMHQDIAFSAVETDQGWIELGQVDVEFASDGTAAAATIHLDNEVGRHLILEVRPLADRVRIRERD